MPGFRDDRSRVPDTENESFATYVYAPYTDTVRQDGSTFSGADLQLVH
ncbi:hypothetical protein [Pengzhenrongella sicca]|uniref:Uncharacterized protein n=1 Tax=Pengzhenrongella sicca TaxID=2819238 RepID=A0A8A4Z9B1_9MICO|nr:hypothetical protein [Pengzhenrongella sicca]QTE28065.1 hypothetical protein J4E96_11730 [Pengzhenrongella sicca]